jgi:nucleoside-diphosphate-sugar epimerase
MQQEILVTGAGGFIGRRLVRRLRALGHTVQALVVRNELDVEDASAVERAVRPAGTIIHLAARVFIPDSFRDPASFYRTNVLGTVHLLEAARRMGARFVLASAYVYGQPRCLPIREDHPLAAHCPYAETKIIAERIFRNYHDTFGVAGAILRPFNVYGPGQDARFLIASLLEQSRRGHLRLQCSQPRRDFVHVDDVVEAFIQAAESQGTAVETYNIGSGRSWSVREVVEIFRKIYGRPLSLEYAERERAGEIEETRADISNAAVKLQWAPRISFEEGLRRLIEEDQAV